jgi:hypothetical protein
VIGLRAGHIDWSVHVPTVEVHLVLMYPDGVGCCSIHSQHAGAFAALCQARTAVPESATCVELVGPSMQWLLRFQAAVVGCAVLVTRCATHGPVMLDGFLSVCFVMCTVHFKSSSVCDLCNSPVSGVMC